MIKTVIWGAGEHGQRILFHIKRKNVKAFIDSNPEKQNKYFCDAITISFETYLKDYADCLIVISTHSEEVSAMLRSRGINNYVCMEDCPEDFQSPNPRNILKDYIQKRIQEQKEYMIVGASLYSLILHDWITEVGGQAKIVWGISGDEGLFSLLKEEYKENIIRFFDNQIDETIVLWTTVEGPLNDYVIGQAASKVKRIFWLSEEIDQYHNLNIEKFKNIHKGKRCFIVATGPSLAVEDLNTLEDNGELCISMNTINYIFDKTSWRPDYYITTDRTEMIENRRALQDMDGRPCFIADSFDRFCQEEHEENVYIYHLGKLWRHKGLIPFSTDFSRTVYNTATVTYAAMELAVYLGFDKIYLLGVDATGINGDNEEYAHFHEMSSTNTKCTCCGKQVKVSYDSARQFVDQSDINIYNATRGGELEIFDRVDFDTLF